MPREDERERWFLSVRERGNRDARIDSRRDDGRAYTTGNLAEPLIHGATYFARLYDVLCGLQRGDWIHFTDWRGDADERLAGPGTEVARVLADAAKRGVHVRGLIWRSHPDQAKFSEQENLHLVETVNEHGGEVLLDERVRKGGSHHQKLFLIRRKDNEDEDVAFVGGIDLCHSRNDDERHLGDPQVYEMSDAYGERPPWHDVQLQVQGPAVGDLATTFRERWEDPAPLDHRNPWRFLQRKAAREPRKPDPLPEMPDDPAPRGPHAIQVLRTYPHKRHHAYPFARKGERSIARAYGKALERVQTLIYVEDQYFWSRDVAETLADALRKKPNLHLIAVLPRYPEQSGFASYPESSGQHEAIEMVKEAGGERVAFYDIENEAGTPIYVHAKVCVMDDVWAMIGSDNLNRRSWTHDSELSCAILDDERDEREPRDPGGLGDQARRFARDVRLTLWREHLGASFGEAEMIDPLLGFALWRRAATERPPGARVVEHHTPKVPRLHRKWARYVYRKSVDPDGRPRRLRRKRTF